MATDAELQFLIRARDDASRALRNVQQALGGMGDRARLTHTNVSGVTHAMTELNNAAEVVEKTFRMFNQTLGAGLQAFSRYDAGMNVVQRITNMAGTEMELFGQKFDEMTSRMEGARTVTRFNEIAGMASRLGVQGSDNILLFTETIGKLETSLSDLGDEAPMLITRVLNATGEGVEGIDRFGNVLVRMAKSASAGEGRIMNLTALIAQATAQFDMGSESMLAMATAAADLNFAPELFGTAMSRTLTQLYEASMNNTEGMRVLSDMTGVTADEFQNLIQNDPTRALLSFARVLDELSDSGKSVSSFLGLFQLQADENRRILGTMAENYEKFVTRVNEARTEAENPTALAQEFSVALQAFERGTTEAANSWELFKVSLGRQLAPTATAILENLGDVLDWLSDKLNTMDEDWAQAMAVIAVALPSIVAATVAMRALGVVMALARIGPLVAGVGSLVKMGAGLIGISAVLRNIGLAAKTAGMLVGGIAASPVLLAGGIAAAVAGAAAVIYQNWDSIRAFFSRTTGEIGDDIARIISEGFRIAVEAAKKLWDGLIGHIESKQPGSGSGAITDNAIAAEAVAKLASDVASYQQLVEEARRLGDLANEAFTAGNVAQGEAFRQQQVSFGQQAKAYERGIEELGSRLAGVDVLQLVPPAGELERLEEQAKALQEGLGQARKEQNEDQAREMQRALERVEAQITAFKMMIADDMVEKLAAEADRMRESLQQALNGGDGALATQLQEELAAAESDLASYQRLLDAVQTQQKQAAGAGIDIGGDIDTSKRTELSDEYREIIDTLDEYSGRMAEIRSQEQALEQLRSLPATDPFFASRGLDPSEVDEYIGRLEGLVAIDRERSDAARFRASELLLEAQGVLAVTGAQRDLITIERERRALYLRQGSVTADELETITDAVNRMSAARREAAVASAELDFSAQLVDAQAVTASERERAEILNSIVDLTRQEGRLTQDQINRLTSGMQEVQRARREAALREENMGLEQELYLAQQITQAQRDRVTVMMQLADYEQRHGALTADARAEMERNLTVLQGMQSLTGLTSTLDAIGQANQDYAYSVTTLQTALDEGRLSLEQFNRLMDRLNETTLAQRDPFADMVRSLQDAVRLAAQLGQYRSEDQQTLSDVIRLERAGVTVTQEQLRLVMELNRVLADVETLRSSGFEGFVNDVGSYRDRILDLQGTLADSLGTALVDAARRGEDAWDNAWKSFQYTMADALSKMFVEKGLARLLDGVDNLFPSMNSSNAQNEAESLAAQLSDLSTGVMQVTAQAVHLNGPVPNSLQPGAMAAPDITAAQIEAASAAAASAAMTQISELPRSNFDPSGMSPDALVAMSRLEQMSGQTFDVNSAYRDPVHNAAVGGAGGSQHMHGNAFDIDASGMDYAERNRLIEQARASGFGGVGAYDNSLHFDTGPTRAWGPDFTSGSIPPWAQGAVNAPRGAMDSDVMEQAAAAQQNLAAAQQATADAAAAAAATQTDLGTTMQTGAQQATMASTTISSMGVSTSMVSTGSQMAANANQQLSAAANTATPAIQGAAGALQQAGAAAASAQAQAQSGGFMSSVMGGIAGSIGPAIVGIGAAAITSRMMGSRSSSGGTPAPSNGGQQTPVLRIIIEEGEMFAARVHTEAEGVVIERTKAQDKKLPYRVAELNQNRRMRS